MAGNRFEPEVSGATDRLYADAVCAQCGTVNPDGSLICKTCGNNLRDQRTIRLTAEIALEGEAPIERRRFFLGALTVLGLLLVLYAALNADNLMTLLVNLQSGPAGTSASVWSGPESATFEEMLAELDNNAATQDEIRAAMNNPVNSESYGGVYVLAMRNPVMGLRQLGLANVRQEDERALFVARLNNGGEIRGQARFQGNYLTASWEDAGALYNNERFAVSGVAAKQEDGSYECFGRSELTDNNYNVLGFKLP